MADTLDDKIDKQDGPALKVERREPSAKGAGITVLRGKETEYEPPLAPRGDDEAAYQDKLKGIDDEGEKLHGAVKGKVPILASTVRIPMRFEGDFLATTTGWDGWRYTDEEMDDVWILVQGLGLEATPAVQLFGIVIGMHGARLAGYVAWKRKGGSAKMHLRNDKLGKDERDIKEEAQE